MNLPEKKDENILIQGWNADGNEWKHLGGLVDYQPQWSTPEKDKKPLRLFSKLFQKITKTNGKNNRK